MGLLADYRGHGDEAGDGGGQVSPRELERLVPRRFDFVFAPRDAGSHNQIWRYLIGIAATFLVALVLQEGAVYLVAVAVTLLSSQFDWAREILPIIKARDVSARWEMFLVFATISFACFALALGLVLRVFHGRGLETVVGIAGRFRFGRFLLGAVIYGAILVVPFLVSLGLAPTALQLNFQPTVFALLLALVIPMLLVQTAFEEMFFRGYLVQAVGAVPGSPLLIVAVPSLIFTAAHLGNPEVSAAPGVLAFYFSFGVFMTLLTIREQGIELVFGAHFMNNFVTAVLVRPENSVIQTPTIFVMPPLGADPVDGAPVMLATAGPVLFWAIMSGIYALTPSRRAG